MATKRQKRAARELTQLSQDMGLLAKAAEEIRGAGGSAMWICEEAP